jgi:formylglycine-generating enzyme required for sulfatase activity
MTAQSEGLTLEHPSGVVLRVGKNAEVRIPTEWEWQWAAMNGKDERDYPWGDWDNYPRANTNKAGIQHRSTAVGMYPHGAAHCGALDMAGNLWEWCLNDYDNPEITDVYGNEESKVLRGGSFNRNQNTAAASYRNHLNPYYGFSNRGFRVVVSAPIASLSSGTLNSESE